MVQPLPFLEDWCQLFASSSVFLQDWLECTWASTTIGAGVWTTVLAAIGWGIYEYTDYKTTHDVYQQAVQYSHEIGYVILALAVIVVAFIAYKGIKKK